MKLQELGTKPTARRMNKINESRFGFRVNYDHMSVDKARKMRSSLDESLGVIRRNYGIHKAEQNPKYMELLMVREGLTRWLEERSERVLSESELGKSEAILAAKDVVDTIQDMLEDIGRMQNEQMPALMDTIRDQIGSEQADAFSGAITPLLQNLYQNIQSAREGADKAARGLAGEQVEQPMGMAGGAPGMSGAPGMGAPGAPDMGSDLDQGDEFGATDAAAGGAEDLGREPR
jgi:hypothetical protein